MAINIEVVINESKLLEKARNIQNSNRRTLTDRERRVLTSKKASDNSSSAKKRQPIGQGTKNYLAVLDEPAANRRQRKPNAYIIEVSADIYETNFAGESPDFLLHFEPVDQNSEPKDDIDVPVDGVDVSVSGAFAPDKGGILVEMKGSPGLSAAGKLGDRRFEGGLLPGTNAYENTVIQNNSNQTGLTGLAYQGPFNVDTQINPNNGAYYPEEFYVEAWIRPEAPGNSDLLWQDIITFQTRISQQPPRLMLLNKGYYDWMGIPDSDPAKFTIPFEDRFSDTYYLAWDAVPAIFEYGTVDVFHETVLQTNQWYHVAVMRYNNYDDLVSRLVVYVNGIPSIMRGNSTDRMQMTGNLMYVGGGFITGRNFIGKIDEVAYWRRAIHYEQNGDTVLSFTPPTEPYDQYSGATWYFWTRYDDALVEAYNSNGSGGLLPAGSGTLGPGNSSFNGQTFFAFDVNRHEPDPGFARYDGYSLGQTYRYFVFDFSQSSQSSTEPALYRIELSVDLVDVTTKKPDNVEYVGDTEFGVNIYPMYLTTNESFVPNLDPYEIDEEDIGDTEIQRLFDIASEQNFQVDPSSASANTNQVIYLEEQPGFGEPKFS